MGPQTMLKTVATSYATLVETARTFKVEVPPEAVATVTAAVSGKEFDPSSVLHAADLEAEFPDDGKSTLSLVYICSWQRQLLD